jgi:3-phosphoshikimate 1-carboxyvinyltransferase
MSGSSLSFTVEPGGKLQGRVRVPGDKSISHRSVMFGALAEGTSEVSGFLDGEDCLCTMRAFEAMGATLARRSSTEFAITGVGLHGLKSPGHVLDLGNSGTSMRLMSGLLAAQKFETTLTGDASLSKRPMRRVIDPLTQMGARIDSQDGRAPLHIHPVTGLRAIEYRSPVASAQIKSSILLAGLYAQGLTQVHEPEASRDHTERMLRTFGVDVEARAGYAALRGGQRLKAARVQVPADISSAAFFMVGAAILPGSDLTLVDVGINPTRTGVIEILRRMGASIELQNPRDFGGEPVADIRIRGGQLHGIDIAKDLVASAIDEFPALFIAAACASGETRLSGAEELRVKESDRIQVMCDGLNALGVDARALPDGMVLRGGAIGGGTIDSRGDHRVAMSFTMASLRATGTIRILDCANVNTSFPGFADLAAAAGVRIGVQSL